MKKIVFIPGNGGSTTQDNWFPSVKMALEKHGLAVVDAEFPDPVLARESQWIPFLKDDLGVDAETVLVGHSSGAVAAMRFAEQFPILGSVLVGAYHTDLGMEEEKVAGYCSRPWQFDLIRQNQQWITLFASQDDPWIPISEPRHLHQHLDCEYHEYKIQGHFGGDYFKPHFPELVMSLLSHLDKEGENSRVIS